MDTFFTFSGLVALITLTFLEIVLGVDNVIFISILSSKLPAAQQGPAQRVGLVCRCNYSNHGAGYRIFAGFSHHRRW
jgi:predicted tellurium resistance membrane protein TerC